MLWGTTGTAQHFAPARISPYWIGALRLVIAALFLWLWVAGTERGTATTPKAVWRRTLLAGACLAGYNLAFFAGVKLTGVAVGTTIAIGSGPVFAGAMQALFTRRVPAPLWWLGTLLAVAGGALVAQGHAGVVRIDASGVLLCLAAGFTYASYTLLAKDLSRHGTPSRTTLRVFGTAAVVALPAAWLIAPAGVGGVLTSGAAVWLVVLYLGVVATGVAYLLFSNALRHISGATGVALAQAEPLTAFTLAVVVLGEPLGIAGLVGMASIMAGLALVVAGERRG
jgi:DME family drug/metabolite transporter